MCSPTRGTCLTGRHYYRYGIFSANVGHLPRGEITISEVLKEQGYLKMYSEHPKRDQNYYGCITELDEQVGRLRQELKDLGVAENTMLWFTSDNGPEGQQAAGAGKTDGLRGRKRALFEGGVRVPSLVEWPGHVAPGSVNNVLMSTLDYFPTMMGVENYSLLVAHNTFNLAMALLRGAVS